MVELSRHDVVVVTGEDGDGGTGLPVPNADCLVVRGGHDPWVLPVEEGRPDVIQVSQQGEQASTLLVVPNFDLHHKHRMAELRS